MTHRICLAPQTAIDFAQLPMIVSGDAELIEKAFQVKASDLPGAYAYSSVQVIGRDGTFKEIRVCIRKEVE